MKKMWNSLKIAFAMYSKIPVPRCEWTKENMSYAMIFFPWVGAVIGGLTYGVFRLKEWCAGKGILALTGQKAAASGAVISELTFTVFLVLIPVLVTGGIHLDGFLDTEDALHSYQPKERKLEILKDSHAGAFAILCCVVYFLAYVGIYSSLTIESVKAVALGFVLSRTLSGLSVVSFPQAREKGMVATFAENARKRTVKIVLGVYLVIVCGLLIGLCGFSGVFAVLAAGSVFFYYYRMTMKQFGGVTGDLAGYFLQMCEIWIAAAAVAGAAVGQV